MPSRFYHALNTFVVFSLTLGFFLFFSTIGVFAAATSVPATTGATLTWGPNSPVPDGYRVFERTEGQSYDYSQPVWEGSATTADVSNLNWDTTYYFVVRAYAGTQESPDSEEVSFMAPKPALATYSISATAGSGGSVSPSGTVSVTEGADQTINIAANAGYHIADVNVDGTSKGAIAAYTFSQVSADHTLVASFTVDTATDSGTTGGTPTPGSVSDDKSSIVIDDGDPGTSYTGSWSVSAGANPYGSQSLYSNTPGSTYSFNSSITGTYDVKVWWTEYSNRCTSVPIKIYDGSTLLETVVVNQQQNGGQWNFLGPYDFSGQARVVIESDGNGCTTGADAVEFSKAASANTPVVIDDGDPGTSYTGSWSVSAGANPYGSQSLYSNTPGSTYSFNSSITGTYDVKVWWTEYSNRCTSVPIKIYDGNTLLETAVVNQQQNGGQWNFLGPYDFSGQARVVIGSDGNGCTTGADAVEFSEQ